MECLGDKCPLVVRAHAAITRWPSTRIEASPYYLVAGMSRFNTQTHGSGTVNPGFECLTVVLTILNGDITTR